MTISFEHEVEGELLLVRAWGRDDDLEDVRRYGLAVIEAALRNECSMVLCDERELDYAIGVVDTYEYAKLVAREAPNLRRVAVVCRPEFVKSADFWEDAVVNRGLEARVFVEPEAALKWLRRPRVACP